MHRYLRPLIVLFASASAALAAPAATDAWVRHVPGNANAAAYVTLTSTTDDALVAARSDCCTRVELHESTIDEQDVFRMRAVDRIALHAGKAVTLAPLGHHIMLIGLKAQPALDGTMPLTLEFASGASQQVVFDLRPVGQSTPAADHDHSHHGHH